MLDLGTEATGRVLGTVAFRGSEASSASCSEGVDPCTTVAGEAVRFENQVLIGAIWSGVSGSM